MQSINIAIKKDGFVETIEVPANYTRKGLAVHVSHNQPKKKRYTKYTVTHICTGVGLPAWRLFFVNGTDAVYSGYSRPSLNQIKTRIKELNLDCRKMSLKEVNEYLKDKLAFNKEV